MKVIHTKDYHINDKIVTVKQGRTKTNLLK
jgi:hypothetical protein